METAGSWRNDITWYPAAATISPPACVAVPSFTSDIFSYARFLDMLKIEKTIARQKERYWSLVLSPINVCQTDGCHTGSLRGSTMKHISSSALLLRDTSSSRTGMQQ